MRRLFLFIFVEMQLVNFQKLSTPKMLDLDFKLFSFDDEVEVNDVKISQRKTIIQEKLYTKRFLKKEKAIEVLNSLPNENESYHVISNGSFDYFNLIPITVELLGNVCDEFYFSTWTMNLSNTKHLFEMFDAGKIKSIAALVGLYFKKRESNVFNELYEGLKKRNQRIFSNENHTKISLLTNGFDYISICGSANFTANPRIEQFTVHNSKVLFDFHKNWMDEIIK